MSKGDVALGIEIHQMSKALAGKPVLDEVEFAVPSGTIAVIEGANGAGKTTLIRILATVISPDTGKVLVNNFDTVKQSLKVRQSVGVSFANERSLYWRISGLQNLQLFGRIGGLSNRRIAKRSGQLLRALELTEAATMRVGQMSTGQRQRLMVARAMLSDPPVLLLDEPFRGLDEAGLSATIDLITSARKRGVTTLVVAPLIDPVLPIADSIHRIRQGMIVPVEGDSGAALRESPP